MMNDQYSENAKHLEILHEALKGGVEAQFELAIALEDEEDNELALGWYQKAAQQGHSGAAFRAGMLCLKLKGEHEKEAVYWLGRAANAGHTDAQHHLAVALERGLGTRLDPEESLRWHRIAASYGHKASQDKLEKLNKYFGN